MDPNIRRIGWCAVGVAGALLLVGLVSHTIVRHAIQIIPLVIGALLLRSRASIAACVLMPVFAFWTLVSILIWMFVLGISRLANGTYTTAEIGCTIVMAACSIDGMFRCLRLKNSLRWWHAAAIMLASFGGQLLVMWVSFLRQFANR